MKCDELLIYAFQNQFNIMTTWAEYCNRFLFFFILSIGLFSIINCNISNGHYDSENSLFLEIAEKVKNKKVIAIGESSHGVGDFFKIKSELVQYLHEHHNFEILAFESGLGDLNMAWSHIDSLSEMELLDKTLFWNFKCEEIVGLFSYIKSESNSQYPLIYTGFDNQMSSSYFINSVQTTISQFDKEMAQELEERLKAYIRWFRAGNNEDEELYKSEAESFVETAMRIQSIFSSNANVIKENHGWTDFQIEVVERICKGFIRTVDVPYEERHLSSQHRDGIMFDNFKWLMNEVYPDKKIIIWAHNGHIERNTFYEYGYKWMGHHLAEYLAEDYYALGIFARSGKTYRQWGDTTIVFDNDTLGMIESLVDIGEWNSSFVDFKSTDIPWASDTLSAFEVENGGVVKFVPSRRFDGVLVLNEVTSPTFLNLGD